MAEGLIMLNNVRGGFYGQVLGEDLADWPIPPLSNELGVPETLVSHDYSSLWYNTPRVNSRLLINIPAGTVAYVINFPQDPSPGARIAIVDLGSKVTSITLNGNGKLIQGQQNFSGSTPGQLSGKSWFYRDDLASWELIQDLTLTDNLPLPASFNDLFIVGTAMRLAPRQGVDVDKNSQAVLVEQLKRAKARYKQYVPVAVIDRRTVSGWTESNGYVDGFIGV